MERHGRGAGDGCYSYTATVTDAAGNVSAASAPLKFTVDTTAPAAPTITDSAVVNGTVSAANDTSTQALKGTTGGGDTVKIYLNGSTAPAYTTIANSSGQWSVTVGALANGAYSYTATATNSAGNVSAASAPLKFTVDTTAPAAPTITDSAVVNGTVSAANDTSTQALKGTTGGGDTVKIYLNGSTRSGLHDDCEFERTMERHGRGAGDGCIQLHGDGDRCRRQCERSERAAQVHRRHDRPRGADDHRQRGRERDRLRGERHVDSGPEGNHRGGRYGQDLSQRIDCARLHDDCEFERPMERHGRGARQWRV